MAGCRREDPVMEYSAVGLWMISTELEHKSRRRLGLSRRQEVQLTGSVGFVTVWQVSTGHGVTGVSL